MNELDLIKPPINYISFTEERPENFVGWVKSYVTYGETSVEKYSHFVNGKLNSINGQPSQIEMLAEDQSKIFKCDWHLNNIMHRLNGPAEIYCIDEQLKVNYYINGHRFSEKEYYFDTRVIKHKLNMILDT